MASIAVLLATLGLYGLITLNVAGRVREFSIRKVLGADLKNLAGNITNQYLVLLIVALSIGAPVSYLLVKVMFDLAYRYHIPIDFSGATIAIILLILVVFGTVATQIRKVLKANPVDGLKAE
ncbi:MAG: FtsX-like permease family protein [Bacteroidota bacterium]